MLASIAGSAATILLAGCLEIGIVGLRGWFVLYYCNVVAAFWQQLLPRSIRLVGGPKLVVLFFSFFFLTMYQDDRGLWCAVTANMIMLVRVDWSREADRAAEKQVKRQMR